MSKKKERLDVFLVENNFFPSREQAKRAVMAGNVLVDNQKKTKPGENISLESKIEILEKQQFVSRGGDKMLKAMKTFSITATDKICIDIGASTGGFSDCLLQHGAKLIYAIDVGYGQLDWSLRNNPKMIVREKVNARYLEIADFEPRPTLAVIDVSFISLDKIIPKTAEILDTSGEIIALIKPQFEADRCDVKKGGIVKDESVHNKCIEKIKNLSNNIGLEVNGVTDSPILGAKGNKEFLIHLLKNEK